MGSSKSSTPLPAGSVVGQGGQVTREPGQNEVSVPIQARQNRNAVAVLSKDKPGEEILPRDESQWSGIVGPDGKRDRNSRTSSGLQIG